jgi:hypothetical protein
MAIDGKYGRVTMEHGNIGEDEPVIVFRAQDKLLPNVLGFYYDLCNSSGSPKHHLNRIQQTSDEVVAWQSTHPTKIPTSDMLKETQ